MKLRPGQTAIDFNTRDIEGNPVNLSSYQGKKVLVSFFRNAACPFCNLRIHQLIKVKDELKEKGLHFIFLFESKKEVIKLSSFLSGMSGITIISDPEKKIYKDYGIENSFFKTLTTFLNAERRAQIGMAKALNLPAEGIEKGTSMTLIPADILIGEDGKIIEAHYGANIGDHIEIEKLKSHL